MENKKALIIIPTYDELENLPKLLPEVLSKDEIIDVLIVDDSSPDGTADWVEYEMKNNPRIKLIIREKKMGLGTAYIAGFKYALENNYDYIFEMDADFSHNPEDLIKLYKACHVEEYDVAIGSRYITGVNVVNWPMNRVLMSYIASIYVRIITGMKIHDTTAGFVCYKRIVLESLDLNKIKFIGYAFQIEMKFKAYLKKFNIVEIPVIFTDRTKGQSKLSSGIISEAIFGVISMKIKSIFKK